MNLAITILTYNRPEQCGYTIREMDAQASDCIRLGLLSTFSITVVDDCTMPEPVSVREDCTRVGATYTRHQSNYGRAQFWRTFDEEIRAFYHTRADLHLVIPDDFKFHELFLSIILRHYNEFRPDVLNPCHDAHRIGTPNWGQIPQKVKEGHYYHGYADCCYLATRRAYDLLRWQVYPINPRRWELNALSSSGVGKQMTTRWAAKSAKIHIIGEQITEHDWHWSKSVMNQERRKTERHGQ